MVVPEKLGTGVLGIVDCVPDQAGHVLVLQSVEDLRPLAPGPHQPGHPQLGEVLGDRRGRLVDSLNELVDRQLLADQRPEKTNASGIGKHPEDLDDKLGLLKGNLAASAITCMHAQIIAERARRATSGVRCPGVGINRAVNRYHRCMSMQSQLEDASRARHHEPQDLSSAACMFRSLGDPGRLAILGHLAAGEHNVKDLTAHLGLAQSTVSAHLACLRDCGLVTFRALGRATLWSLTADREMLGVLVAAERLLEATGSAVALCPTFGADANR